MVLATVIFVFEHSCWRKIAKFSGVFHDDKTRRTPRISHSSKWSFEVDRRRHLSGVCLFCGLVHEFSGVYVLVDCVRLHTCWIVWIFCSSRKFSGVCGFVCLVWRLRNLILWRIVRIFRVDLSRGSFLFCKLSYLYFDVDRNILIQDYCTEFQWKPWHVSFRSLFASLDLVT